MRRQVIPQKIAKPRHCMNVNDYSEAPADTLKLNDIGDCNLSLDRAMAFDPYNVAGPRDRSS